MSLLKELQALTKEANETYSEENYVSVKTALREAARRGLSEMYFDEGIGELEINQALVHALRLEGLEVVFSHRNDRRGYDVCWLV